MELLFDPLFPVLALVDVVAIRPSYSSVFHSEKKDITLNRLAYMQKSHKFYQQITSTPKTHEARAQTEHGGTHANLKCLPVLKIMTPSLSPPIPSKSLCTLSLFFVARGYVAGVVVVVVVWLQDTGMAGVCPWRQRAY